MKSDSGDYVQYLETIIHDDGKPLNCISEFVNFSLKTDFSI